MAVRSDSEGFKPFGFVGEAPVPRWRVVFTLNRHSRCYVEYLLDNNSGSVPLGHFRSRVVSWLRAGHREGSALLAWLSEARTGDFRNRVGTDIVFLHNECWNIDDELSKHDGPIDLCSNNFAGTFSNITLEVVESFSVSKLIDFLTVLLGEARPLAYSHISLPVPVGPPWQSDRSQRAFDY